MSSRLLLISPVRNEAEHLERVARSVAAQSVRPDVWVVVDDGSDDGTLELLARLCEEIAFLRVVRAPQEATEGRDRLARAAAPRAFNVGLRSVDHAGEYAFVGKLDGDVELPPDYYEHLLERFETDASLGMACGDLVERRGGDWKRIRVPSHHVHGAVKLYRRECFASIGGVQERLGWDTIDETYARMRGYRTRSFSDIVARHHREWGSADGTLRGRARHGQCAYIAGYGLFWVTLRSVKLATVKPYVSSGAAFLLGYVRSAARRVPRVEDDEYRRYVRRELRGRLLGRLRPTAST